MVFDEEMDHKHPFWDEALLIINELAPVTRRDDWWGTDGPKTIIFRALVAAQKGESRVRSTPQERDRINSKHGYTKQAAKLGKSGRINYDLGNRADA